MKGRNYVQWIELESFLTTLPKWINKTNPLFAIQQTFNLQDMDRSKVAFLILNLVCSCGLFYQIFQISRQYFKFQTRIDSKITLIESISNVSIHSCHCFWEVIDLTKWNRYKNQNLKWPLKPKEIDDMFEEITFGEMLDWTPPIENVISNCFLRKPGNYLSDSDFTEYNQSDCNRFFNVKKYFHREFICYMFQLTQAATGGKAYSIDKVLFTKNEQSCMFAIEMNDTSFHHSDYLITFAQAEDTNLLFSSGMTEYTKRYVKYPTIPNKIKINYQTLKTSMQPAPYDTNCRDFGSETHTHRYLECLNHQINRSTSHMLLTYPIFNATFEKIAVPATKNPKVLQAYAKAEIDCQRIIGPHYDPCIFSTTVSYPTTVSFASLHPIVELLWPRTIQISVSFEPLMVFLDFFIYIFSSSGTWYGFSFFGFGMLVNKEIYRNNSISIGNTQKHMNFPYHARMRKELDTLKKEILTLKLESVNMKRRIKKQSK